MRTATVEGLNVAYREAGQGSPVLLLHGWPTSSYLWRQVMPAIAERNRVIAIDLPGFGRSSKPAEGYGFAFFERVLDGFLEGLEIDRVAIAGHDLGGPITLHWALHRPERVSRVALLNTLVYPNFSSTVVDFVRSLLDPERRDSLTCPDGLAEVMRTGVADGSTLSEEVIAAVQEPFSSPQDRLALAAAGLGLGRTGFKEIARLLPGLRVPLRIVYGARDRLLPDIADTVTRLRVDVPHAEVTELPECGHFVQEDAPAEVGALLAEFFAATNSPLPTSCRDMPQRRTASRDTG